MTSRPRPSDFAADYATVLEKLAAALRPRPKVYAWQWGAEHFRLPAGNRKGDLLDLTVTPHLKEPLENLHPDSPWTEIWVMKSNQSAFTTAAMVWAGSLIDSEHADFIMYVMPTITAARDFVTEKLDDAIAATEPLAKLVSDQKSRAADGSKTLSKKFPGGRMILTGANSSTDLSSKTTRYAIADEVDRWPVDLDKQGDPMAMLDARMTGYSRFRQQKKLVISTPTLKGSSRIERGYLAGDQRHWTVPCTRCGGPIHLAWENLRYEETAPHEPRYQCQLCGRENLAHEQRAMVLAGGWRPHAAAPGRQPSYLFDSLSSLLTSWDHVVGEWVKARGDPVQEKSFANLWLARTYEELASESDPAAIVRAAEAGHIPGVVPAEVGATILAVDVQGDWLDWAVWGFGPAPTTTVVEQWLIAAGQIHGDLHTEEPWEELDRLGARAWPQAGGRMLATDLNVIDTGGNHTERVFHYLHGKRRWRGLKGGSWRSGGARPPAVSTPKRHEVRDIRGRPLFRVPYWTTHTHDAKIWFLAALKDLEKGVEKPGRLHLPRELVDVAYAEQMTAEILVPREKRDGRVVSEWHQLRKRNEGLDLAVYARVFAFAPFPNGLGLDRLDGEAWARRLAERHAPPTGQMGLFDMPAPKPAAPTQQATAPAPPPAAPQGGPATAAARLAALNRIRR